MGNGSARLIMLARMVAFIARMGAGGPVLKGHQSQNGWHCLEPRREGAGNGESRQNREALGAGRHAGP